MTNPTSNFNWQMPTSTDLVTDLPADFEVFGQAVDTTMADLKGGTTGQILSKTSNTDMDFTWITNDQGDLTEITAGTGITVTSPTGPIPTVAIDTATVPRLASSNTFSTNQIVSCATTSAALRVTQTGSGNSLLVEDSANPDSTPMVVTSDGTIVTGNTTAGVSMGYSGIAGTIPRVQATGTTSGTGSIGVFNWANNSASASAIMISKSKSGTIGTYGATTTNDDVGAVVFNADDGTEFQRSSMIFAEVDGTVSTGIVPGRMIFYTTNSSGVLTERYRIDSNGRNVFTGSITTGVPLQKTADFTLASTENWIVNMKTGSGLVITLPNALTYAGRQLTITNWQAQTVAASASVVVKNNAAAGTAILPATIGTWAELVSDGTNWIMTKYKDI